VRANELNALLRTLLECEEGVSVLNFTPFKPPQIETDGDLHFPAVNPPLPELSPFMTEQAALNLVGNRPHLLRELLVSGSCDCSYSVTGLSRFRVNIFSQRGTYSIVMRRLATRLPTIHDLVLPPLFQKLAELESGLVLVAGGAGSGKSTTLAALVHEINLTRPLHIVTLEDPIEVLHRHEIGTVNQRELGADFSTFAHGLRAALRQSPNVIVVGELRDRETLEVALTAAEAGHLVLTTVQASGVSQTIQRLVGMFLPEEQGRVRARLGEVLRCAVGQMLAPKEGGGRVLVLELLTMTQRTRELIVLGETETRTFYLAMAEGTARGMQTFDQHLARLVDDGQISEATARNFATDRGALGRNLERLRAERAGGAGAAEPKLPVAQGRAKL